MNYQKGSTPTKCLVLLVNGLLAPMILAQFALSHWLVTLRHTHYLTPASEFFLWA